MLGAAQSALTPGQIIAGGYRVDRPLSAGGMGSVYVVTQLNTQRQRALKVMHPELAQHPRFLERFRQEAQVGALIQSDHIVEVVDAGVDDATGMPYLAMELLDGADLADTMEQRGPLAPDEVATIYEQLCHALGAAHRASIVHRDLKPENLFLARSRRADSDWTLKILDFGIAKVVAEAQTASRATQSIGSPLWMAPEQTQAGAQITPQTDVWALGLIAFFLLTGRPFWSAANEETVEQMRLLREIAFEPLLSASARAHQLGVGHMLPAGFDAWFARCVARAAGDRFATTDELMRGLMTILRTGPAQRLSAPGSNPQAVVVAPISADIATGQYAPNLIEGTAPAAPAVPVATAPGPAPAMTAPGQPPAMTAPGQPPAMTAPGAAPAMTAPQMAHVPVAQPIAEPQSSSKTPLIAAIAGIVVLAGAAGLFFVLQPEETSSTEPLFEEKETAEETNADPDGEESAAIEPDTPEPDGAGGADSTAANTPPAASSPRAFPKPTGRWPSTKNTNKTNVKPPPKPDPPPPPRPPPPRPPPKPPSMYGKPCKTAAQCGPGYDCSYGKKCVPR